MLTMIFFQIKYTKNEHFIQQVEFEGNLIFEWHFDYKLQLTFLIIVPSLLKTVLKNYQQSNSLFYLMF